MKVDGAVCADANDGNTEVFDVCKFCAGSDGFVAISTLLYEVAVGNPCVVTGGATGAIEDCTGSFVISGQPNALAGVVLGTELLGAV
jgi:hypothetical protein